MTSSYNPVDELCVSDLLYMALLMGVTLSSVQTSALNRSSRLVYTQLFAVNYAAPVILT